MMLTDKNHQLSLNNMFNEKEQKIIEWGVQNGKTKEEVMNAITNYRVGIPTIAPAEEIQPEVEEPGYFRRVGRQYIKSAKEIISGVKKGAEVAEAGITEAREREGFFAPVTGALRATGGLLRTGLRTVGAVARGAFAPVVEAPGIKQALEGIATGILKIPGIQNIIKNAEQLAQQYPEQAQDIEDVVSVAALFAGKRGVRAGREVTGRAGLAVGRAADRPVSAVGRGLKETGVKVYGITVTPKEATVRALVAYDKTQPTLIGRVKNLLTRKVVGKGKPVITPAETAARKGLWGTEYSLGVRAAKASDDLWKNIIQPRLKVAGKVNMKDFLDDLAKEINKIPELGRRADMKKAFITFRADYKNVGNITLEKLQTYKEGWAKFVPESVYKGKPVAAARREVQVEAAKRARRIIYESVGEEGKMAYIDYGNLKSITEAGIKSLKDPAKQSIHRLIWQTFMDKAITPVATVSGLILYRTGEGLEFIGKAGATKVSDIVK